MTRFARAALLASVAATVMLTRGPADATQDRRAHPPTGHQARFAAFQPSTYSAEARTVELVLSVGAPVNRGYFIEELEISAEAVDLGRVARGLCPLLNAHNKWEINAVLGTITSARFEKIDGVLALVATAQFADTPAGREAEGMVARGELRGVSIGYAPKQWSIVSIDAETETHTWRATSWELLEGSLVPVPADASAGVRSAVSQPGAGATAETQEDEMRRSLMAGAAASALVTMAPETGSGSGGAAATTEQRSTEAAPAAPATPAPETRAAAPAAVAGGGGTGAAVSRFSVSQALEFEDQARTFGVEVRARELVQQNERGEISIETARAMLMQAAAEQQRAQTSAVAPAAGTAGRTADSQAASREAIVEAIVSRATGKDPSERARQFMNYRLLEIAIDRAGLNPRERDATVILRAAHTSSDFPMILEAASNKILLDRYQTAVPTYRSIARRRDLRDFKPTKLLRIGDFPTLVEYKEDGEIKAGTINEGREQVTLASYGRIVRISRQALVNDDLGAFDDVFGSIGTTVALFENATFFTMKGSVGPKLADGKAVFHADHANLAASGTVIDIDNLGKARAAIRKQKNLDGNNLNLAPKILLVGPDKETEADQITASISPALTGSVNPFSGKLQVVTEGSIAGNAWEVYADPSMAPVWSYGYLADAPGPRVMTDEPFNVDGIAMRVTLDFYSGATDYRGGYRNPGA